MLCEKTSRQLGYNLRTARASWFAPKHRRRRKHESLLAKKASGLERLVATVVALGSCSIPHCLWQRATREDVARMQSSSLGMWPCIAS